MEELKLLKPLLEYDYKHEKYSFTYRYLLLHGYSNQLWYF
jgi:hypothetical protein